jgi:surfeit locus 1 family protein
MTGRAHLLFALPLLLAGLVATAALGNWQTRRAAQKEALAAAWRAARAAAPIDVRAARDLPADPAHLPARVVARGDLLHANEVWLDNRFMDGRAGFFVVAPLRLAGSGDLVLVNRGWAPRNTSDRMRLPPIGRPAGSVQIEGVAVAGVARLLELGGATAASRSTPIRQNLDIGQMQAMLGFPVPPAVIQQESAMDDGLLRNWMPVDSGAQRNRGYALQWYALAVLLGLLAAGVAWRAWRLGPLQQQVVP